jgi:hypothetical protein
MNKKDLIDRVTSSQDATPQGVYKELRRQISKGVILLHKNAVSFNLLFINKEYDRWNSVLRNYEVNRNLKDHFLDLQEGESITLKFKNLNDLDAYWVHAFFILEKQLKLSRHSYSIIPHDWFFYARKETDVFWTKGQKEKSRIIITNPKAIDKDVSMQRRSSGYEVALSLNPFQQNENEYYTLIDGFIFRITLGSKITEGLKDFLDSNSKITAVDSNEINRLINTTSICTMKITRNLSKYNKMLTKCKKYFD